MRATQSSTCSKPYNQPINNQPEQTMNYFDTRYQAFKAFPNAIIRKVLNHHVNANAGQYVVFNDYTTYETWKRCGHVK
jgi:hypothetical protein